jgi:phenylacetate-CoA ligase
MKAAMTSSDTLFPQYRAVIERAFSCKVFNHLGQNEDILTATECEEFSGLHINVENCIAETLDENDLPVHGVEGRFVSTHLENYVSPLIRYVVGDVGLLDETWKKCACGRSHQKILEFTGRDDEIILTPDGRRVGCGSMNQPMKTMHTSIHKSQIIQERLDLLRVKIVPTNDWNDSIHLAEFEKNLRRQVGNTIKVSIELVADIPSRPNGKYQFIVSKLEKE